MKLKKIYIKNVLSYNEETIEFNNGLNIFVGPNGSGKSNLLNIIIYVLKRFCFKNYEITRSFGIERLGYKKYIIREKNPLYNSSENFFLSKHKLLYDCPSSISFTIQFEKNDIKNLHEIKKYKKELFNFFENMIESISFMDEKYTISPEKIKPFFEICDDDLMVGEDISINLIENNNTWIIENENKYQYTKYMKLFSLMYDLLNLINVPHSVRNPFVFFEAYRNNSKETTMVSISDLNNNNYINTQSLANISSLAYSIGTYSTYIMMATKKYGELHRKCLEIKNGLKKFNNNKEYVKLKDFFKKFGYDINLKCIETNNNVYQFYLKKDDLEIEIDTISSGEREIINFIFGLFLEQLSDGIAIIDEPELHLHPNWQKKLIQVFKEETKNSNIQILFVTHSASFISYNIFNNIFRIYKDKSFSKCIRVTSLMQDVDDDLFRKNLTVVNATNNEKIFFANNVILVEGITDEILFKKIYESEIGLIPDGLEFVSISGKNNLNNFKVILDQLKICYYYIGDYDNLYDFPELNEFFSTDKKRQLNDLKKKKNQTYSCLDLLKSIDLLVKNNNEENYQLLSTNYALYNERFVRIKDNLSENDLEIIDNFINEKYKENFYILKHGEIENYLGIGNSNKSLGFNKVISFLNDAHEYETFKKTYFFEELYSIIKDINEKVYDQNNGL